MKVSFKHIILAVAVICSMDLPAYSQCYDYDSIKGLPSREELLGSLKMAEKNYAAHRDQYEKQIATLQEMLRHTKNKSGLAKTDGGTARLNHTIDSLTNVSLADKREIELLKNECQSKHDTILSLKAELEPLLVFRKAYLVNLFKESEDYLKLPYSQISLERLNALKDKLSEYSADREVANAISSIDKTIANKGYVTSMERAISTPYNRAEIEKARSSFKKLRKSDYSPAQWEELDNLDKYLSRYNLSLITFQTIIKKDNEIISTFGGGSQTQRKDCIDEIKEVFKPYEEREIGKGINSVPYLKSRFETYRKWAMSNPLAKSQEIERIEEEIMILKPKE